MKDKLKEIFSLCDTAIKDAMLQLGQERFDHFLLFLARGEILPHQEGINKYVSDYTSDLRENFYQREYCVRYLKRNYSQEGFNYDTEDDIYELITEMLIYSHIWEDVGFLKKLMRLSTLLIGEEYPWTTEEIEKHERYYTIITGQIIKPLKRKKLKLGELLECAYSSNIRNSFAHSMYEIIPYSRSIRIWGTRPREYNYNITFDDFQEKFLYTIRIWNQLFYQFEEFRLIAAQNKMKSSVIKLPSDDGQIFLGAEMRERSGKLEPSIRFFIPHKDE